MAENHSDNYFKIKAYYDNGLWDINRVRKVVGKPQGITEEEFTEITNEPY